jgi:hypothetical protein
MDAQGYFAFYLPASMQLRSTVRCEECAWGSSYEGESIRLHATYTSWDEGYSTEYLAKQREYHIESIEIGGKRAVVQSWRSTDSQDGFAYVAEARFYADNGKLVARFSASGKSQADVDIAKQIFRTVCCFKR